MARASATSEALRPVPLNMGICALLVGTVLGPALVQGPDGLDFWIGSWTCTGNSLRPDGTWVKTDAENVIEKTLDGKVIQENFKMGDFVGKSWSVYQPATETWRQTWVDNSGGYIVLAGKSDGKDMTLTTLPDPDKPRDSSRMVFTNIQKDSFTWRWEKSEDGGKTWQLRWELLYKRKTPSLGP